jgi:hypothetical protein
MNLRDILSEFEASPNTRIDDQFRKERSQILSNVELALEERGNEEASREGAFNRLSDVRILLRQAENEYITKLKEIERQKDNEIKRLSRIVDHCKEEQDRITHTKMSIFRHILKKARVQKEAEASQRLHSAQRELTLAVQYFTAEQERCRNEYERRKQNLSEQIRDYQKEIENQEIDSSLEIRRVACETLSSVVIALLQRS